LIVDYPGYGRSSGCGSPLAGAVQLVLAERTSKHSEFVVGHPAGRYDKMHLVPFGEYVPLYDVLPIMKYFAPYEYDYSVQPGTRQTHFSLGRYSFGAAICYEDTDPFLARRLVTPDASERPVDFIVNSSNDGWFKGSSEHEEHLAIARFRAVESRRPVIRAVNLGVSAVIDSNGSVLPPDTVAESNEPGKAPQGLETVPIWAVETPSGWTASLPPSRWQEFKAKPGVLLARLPIDHRESLYSIYGDWLALLCWGGLLVGVIEAFSGRRRPEVTT
jgi:apolipoprotein N-acyltransferase